MSIKQAAMKKKKILFLCGNNKGRTSGCGVCLFSSVMEYHLINVKSRMEGNAGFCASLCTCWLSFLKEVISNPLLTLTVRPLSRCCTFISSWENTRAR